MHEILKSLWRGQINPSERFFERDSEYSRLNHRLGILSDQLLLMLSDEGKQCFEEIEQIIYDMESISEEETFIQGVRLGAQMMLASVSEPRGQFHM